MVEDRVSLKRRGRVFVGLCPFHEERTPSFHVDPEKRLFYCFGCQAGGDVFRFIEKFEHKSFVEAVRTLADHANIPPPEVRGEKADRKKACFAICREAEALFRKSLSLTEGERARRYLFEDRRLAKETVDRFGLGYAAPGTLLKNVSPSRREAWETYGLLRKGAGGYREFFRERIMVPIRLEYGPAVAFGGRTLGPTTGTPKYLNSPEHPFFRKKEILFGLDQAREAVESKRRVVVVEGYFDVMVLSEAGIRPVVAPLGTAVTESHLIHLSRLADEVIFIFDGDRAGQDAVARVADRFVFDSRIPLRAARTPEGMDPDEWVRRDGPDAVWSAIETARPIVDFVMDLFEERVSRPGAQKKESLLEPFYALAKKITDPQELDGFLSRGAALFRLNKDLLAQGLFREETLRADAVSGQSPGSPSNRELMERNLVLELVRLWGDGGGPHPAESLKPELFAFLTVERLSDFVRKLWTVPQAGPEQIREMVLGEPRLAEAWIGFPEDRDSRSQRLADLVAQVRRLSRRDRVSA